MNKDNEKNHHIPRFPFHFTALLSFLILLLTINTVSCNKIDYCYTQEMWYNKQKEEEKRLSLIADELRPTFSICDTMANTGSILLRGKALVWDMEKDRLFWSLTAVPPPPLPPKYSDDWDIPKIAYDLPKYLIAKSTDEIITVFAVYKPTSSYDNNFWGDAQVNTINTKILVAYWPTKEAAGKKIIIHDAWQYGNDPAPIVRDWIIGLSSAR
jgi:hypothetical protein